MESFIRWQNITIQQFGYALNLILTFSVATLGFQVSILLNNEFQFTCYQKYMLLTSMFFLFVSIIAGLACVYNRLIDFRITAKIANLRENSATAQQLGTFRKEVKKRGKLSWQLFYCQICTFGIGILLTVAPIALYVIFPL